MKGSLFPPSVWVVWDSMNMSPESPLVLPAPQGLGSLLSGESQMLLLLPYFLTLLAISASLWAGLFGLCCALGGESHSSSEA